MSQDFDLEAPAINSYLNIILRYLKLYQDCSINRQFSAAYRALKSIILCLPPKGQEILKLELEKLIIHEQDTNAISSFEQLDEMFQKVMAWLYPNLLEFHFNNAKPLNRNKPHIGEKQY